MLPDRRCLVSINPDTSYALKMGKGLPLKNTGYKRCAERSVSVVVSVSVSKGGKLGCYLANCGHQPLERGYCERVTGALSRLPIASLRSLLFTVLTKKNLSLVAWIKALEIKFWRSRGARSSGRWRVASSCRCPWTGTAAPSRSCAQLSMTRS